VINANHLRRARLLAGVSQRAVARHAGVSYQTIRRLENGDSADALPLGVLRKIASGVGIPLCALLCDENTMADPTDLATSDETTLDIAQATLLRRIHRGQRITKTLTSTERKFVLPSLIR
jgi:transcriptional regulator with XRE-family HTH domain